MDLHIELGNDAMKTRSDVVKALQELARRIERGDDYGKVLDVNGNSVGSWSLHIALKDD